MSMFKKSFSIVVVAGLLITSCAKKDNNVTTTDYTGSIQVNFNNYIDGNGDFGFLKAGLPAKDEYVTFNVEVKLSNTIDPAPADINVYLLKVDALVSEYNTKNGTLYSPVSTAQNGISFDFTKPAVIKKGQRKGSFPVQINTARLGFTQQWAVGLGILKAEGATINDLQAKLVIDLTALNKYDGVYTLKSKMLNWNVPSDPQSNFTISNTPWTWPGDVLMITSSGNSVNMFDDWGFLDYIHPIQTTTAWSAFGSTNPRFVFDPTTNALVDCVNDFPNPPNGRTFQVNPAVTTSRWDPATGNIYAAIILKQPGRTDLQIFDTLEYIGPR